MLLGGTSRWRAACIVVPLATVAASVSEATPPACLSGFVRDAAGRPVVEADLDLFDLETGTSVSASGDNTDAYGFYNVCVPPGRYRVTFAPPPGPRLLGKEFPEIDLRANGGREMDVVLEDGRMVTGFVRTADGAPLGGVDVDVDRASGGRLFTPHDKSDPGSGAYAIVVPDGLYRFRFKPPRGARWQGAQISSIFVTGDLSLDVTLPPGALLYGHVADDTGRPLAGVALDLRGRADGAKAFVVNGSTGEDGAYEATVPLGTFEVRFDPPSGSRLVAARVDSLTIGGDTRLDRSLTVGFLVSAVVRDSAGAPLEGAGVSVIEETSGQKLYLPDDETDEDGRAELAVPPGRHSFRFDPPSEVELDRLELRGVLVTRDLTLSAQFPGLGWVHLTGRVVDSAGLGVAGATVHGFAVPGEKPIGTPIHGTDASGAFDLILPRGSFELCVAAPREARLVARRLAPITVNGDMALGDVVLETGALLTVRVKDSAAVPVGGADLRLVATPGGNEVYTPFGRTNADGVAVVALSPGRYDATVMPPEDAALSQTTLAGVEALSDMTVDVVLQSLEEPGPHIASFHSLAPNPFRRAIEIGVRVRAPARVGIDLYDAAGRHVRRLEHGDKPASTFSCAWDGRREDGAPVPSGVYFVSLRAPGTTETRKILLVR